MSKEPDNAAIHESQRRVLYSSGWSKQRKMKQSNDMYGIQVTMQSCLDAGAGTDLLIQIVAMYRRYHAGNEEMQSFIGDLEVRYITSLSGGKAD